MKITCNRRKMSLIILTANFEPNNHFLAFSQHLHVLNIHLLHLRLHKQDFVDTSENALKHEY